MYYTLMARATKLAVARRVRGAPLVIHTRTGYEISSTVSCIDSTNIMANQWALTIEVKKGQEKIFRKWMWDYKSNIS